MPGKVFLNVNSVIVQFIWYVSSAYDILLYVALIDWLIELNQYVDIFLKVT